MFFIFGREQVLHSSHGPHSPFTAEMGSRSHTNEGRHQGHLEEGIRAEEGSGGDQMCE